MKQTNFDRYLKRQLADPAFAHLFEQAGQAWDVALQFAAPALYRRTRRTALKRASQSWRGK